jgi:sialidase-1
VSGTSTSTWSNGTKVVYRIPALVSTKSGKLLAFASERLGGSGDESVTNLVQRTSGDGGKTWAPITLALPNGGASSSPWALSDATTGDILLFFNADSIGNLKCECTVSYSRSTDDGTTWSKLVRLPKTSGYYGSSLTTGITLQSDAHKGRLVMCMREICKNSCPNDYHSFASYSDDHGLTWNSSKYLAKGTTECQIAELSTGQLYLSTRPLGYPTGKGCFE